MDIDKIDLTAREKNSLKAKVKTIIKRNVIFGFYNGKGFLFDYNAGGNEIINLIHSKNDEIGKQSGLSSGEIIRLRSKARKLIDNEFESYFELGLKAYDWQRGNEKLKKFVTCFK